MASAIIPVLVLLLFVLQGLRRVNRQTIEAARTLGMTRGTILGRVILPQARRWIVRGVLLAAVIAAIEVTALLHYGVI